MKLAQQMHQAGRVTEADYQPPLLSGMVREGNRNLRSGLRVQSHSEVENLCTCRESREWGKICPHALAVGLAFIERESAPKAMEPARPRAEVANHPAAKFVELGTEAATPIALHFILPPNFESAWARQQIMLVTEVELGGKRAMPSTLVAAKIYACDTSDLAAIDVLAQIAGDIAAVAAMRMLTPEEFLRLLGGLRSHPRVTFGKTASVEISSITARPRLRLRGRPEGRVSARSAQDESNALDRTCGSMSLLKTDAQEHPHLAAKEEEDESISVQIILAHDERILSAGGEAWLQAGNVFRPLAEGLPADLRSYLNGPVSLRGERAQRFLAFAVPRLREWFEVETEGGSALPKVQTAHPAFLLKIEGSLRELRAELQVQYPGGTWKRPQRRDAGLEAGTLEYLPDSRSIVFVRDHDAERAALDGLEAFGFVERGDRLVLANENLIARFFAFEYPRLQRNWEVQLSAQATKASTDLQPLAPRLEVVGSGEDWFELRYSLSSADGQMFSANELQRLLRSGQSKAPLRNGRTAVFDTDAITDFEEVLRDVDPSQTQPGTYRIDRTHASYVTHTAQELGFPLWQPLAENRAPAAPALGPVGDLLREYQRIGVTWLWRLAQNNLGGILADEMGLGKTVQTLAFLQARHSNEPALIVCPSSLVTNWRNEAQRFTPELRVLVLEGAERHARFDQIDQSDLVLTSYALLQRDAERYRAIQFSTAVLDEAQHIKNPDTQNAQTAFALRARHRFVLTGTPMENSVRDLWSLMNFVLPGYLGSRADFRERYEQPLTRGAAPEVQRRLARRMRPFLLRRLKTEVAKDLPEKLEQQVICDLTAQQRAAYDGLLREIQSGLRTKPANVGAARMKMLVGLLRLRQVCCDLRLLGVAQVSNLQDPGKSKLEPCTTSPASAKLELLDELLEEAMDGGHRVLVFSQFVSMLRLIRERLESQSIRFSYLDGQTKERQAVVDQFQGDDTIPVFLMSLKAGGVGLNLSAADTVIHFDPWWNYAAEAQATDRAHRIGQTRVVTAYKLIARDTVEEKIVKLQARKRSATEATIGSEEPMMSGLTTEDLEELLG